MARERQFINDQLVTIKRFNPAASPVHAAEAPASAPAPEAPIQAAPPPAPDPIPPPEELAVGETASSPAPEANAGTGIAPLLRREHETLQAGLLENERSEYERRREEVLRQLDDAIAAAAQDKLERETRLRLLMDFRSQVELQTPESARDLSPAHFRAARRTVESAHLELLKAEAAKPTAEHAVQPGHIEFASLSLGQLTRLGLGLTWPLIAALLLAAIIVAIVLGRLF